MAIIGKIKTLFEDEAHTEAIFPRTKTKAITNDNGENLDVVIEELKKSVSDGKSAVAGAITAKGVNTASDATFAQMATNIGAIKKGSGNAQPEHVLNPYTFTNDSGEEQVGTMIDRTKVDPTVGGINDDYYFVGVHKGGLPQYTTTSTSKETLISLSPPDGYYRYGNSYVGIPASEFGNAQAGHVLEGADFTSSAGLRVQGIIPVREAYTGALSCAESEGTTFIQIPHGAYLAGGGSGYPEITIPNSSIPVNARPVTAIFATSYTYHTDLTEYINDTIDAGGNQNKGVYLSIINVAYASVQVSNDLVNWYDYLYTSTNGSNSGDWGTPQNVCGSNCQFRYFRCVTKGYGNGGRNYTAWGVFVS